VGARTWTPDTPEKLTENLPEPERQMVLSVFEEALAKYGKDMSSLTFESYEGKASIMALQRKLILITDMLLNCKYHMTWAFCSVGIELQKKLLSAGDVHDWSIDELMEASDRVHALERAYNYREGFDRKDDKLPKRFFTQSLPGFYPDDVLDYEKFEQAKDEYYEAMRWDVKTGAPNRETLVELGLEDVAADLEKRGLLE
jgi:aldehyde:ferredoxin oxidoreductase